MALEDVLEGGIGRGVQEWQHIPNEVLRQDRRKKKADNWAAKHRAELADEWAERQRQEAAAFFDEMGKANEWARRNVPGYGGAADVTGQTLEYLSRTGREIAIDLADIVNPLGPRASQVVMDPVGHTRAVKEEAAKGWTPLIPEGPIRGAAGALGQILYEAATGAGRTEGIEAVTLARTNPEAYEALREAERQKLAQEWERWQREPTNPLVELGGEAINPLNWIGPVEVAGLARAGVRGVKAAAPAVREAAPQLSSFARALLEGERGGGTIGREGEELGKELGKEVGKQGGFFKPGEVPPQFPSKPIQGGEVRASELFGEPQFPEGPEGDIMRARWEREKALANGQLDMFGVEPPPETQAPLAPVKTPVEETQRAADAEAGLRRANTTFPVSEIQADPERFQFKLAAGAGGVTGPLKGVEQWNPALAQGIMVWQDPADGLTYVVNGHNRLALAKKLGVQNLENVYFIDADTAAKARALGAMTNIAEGHGTALDAAKFFRDSGLTAEEVLKELPSRQKMVTDGLALSRLNDTLFRQVIQGDLAVERGAIIGARLEDPALQTKLVQMLDQQAKRGKSITNDVVAELADMVAGAPRQVATQTTLFGDEAITQSFALEKAEILADVKGRLAHDKRIFGVAAAYGAELERGGNIIQRAASQNISEQAAQLLGVFDVVKHHAGGIADIIDDGARRIGAGEQAAKVKGEVYERVVQALSEVGRGGEKGGAYPGAPVPGMARTPPERPITTPAPEQAPRPVEPAPPVPVPTPPTKAPIRYSGGDFREDLKIIGRYTDEEADAISKITEATARVAGKSLDDYLTENIQWLRRGRTEEDVKGAYEVAADGRAVISLFQKADVTTMFHELAHMWREKALNGADLGIVERWLGIKEGKWLDSHDETFARALERYFYDGIAPTEELKPVFAKLKQWFMDVYRAIEGGPLDVEISPEVRGVFDRMFGKMPESFPGRTRLIPPTATPEEALTAWGAFKEGGRPGGPGVARPPTAPPTAQPPVQPPTPPTGAGAIPPTTRPTQPPLIPPSFPGRTPAGRLPARPPAQPPLPPPGAPPTGGAPGPSVDPYQQLQNALRPDRPTLWQRTAETAGRFMRAMYDRNWNLGGLEQETGIPVHKMAQIVSGSVAAGEDRIRRFILPIVEPLGKDVKHLEEYMVLQRNKDILARNPQAQLPGGIAGQAANTEALRRLAARMGAAKTQQVEDAARQLWDVNDRLILQPLRDAGLIGRKAYQAMKSANPHYIDFHRADFSITDEVERIMTRPEANVSGVNIERLELAGSARKLDQPLARTEAQIIRTRVLISRNEAAKTIVKALLEKQRNTGQKIVKLLSPSQAAEHSNITDTITFFQRGRKVTAQVPPVYATIAKGLEGEIGNTFLNIMRATSAPLRAGAVTYNPAFFLANPLRDAISALYRERLIPLSPDYIKGWVAALTKNTDFTDAAEAGVLMSGIVDNFRSTEALARARGVGKIQVENWKDALLLIPRLIERANITGEQATRIATYHKLRGEGLSKLDAAIRARDVTVDFAKAGNVMKMVNQFIPFSNASVQGAANTVRLMKDNPRQALAASGILATPTILAYLWNQRYETSNMIPDYEYTQNWVLQVGEGTKAPDPKAPGAVEKFPIYLKIPKGPLGGFITAPVEMAMRLAFAKDDRSVVENLLQGLGTMAQTISPIEPSITGVLPPALSTPVGVAANRDIWSGREIVPQREAGRPPELRYGPEATREAIAIGEKFHVSPRVIDWAIRDYTAGVGQQVSWLADVALGALGYNPTLPGAAKQQPLSQAEAAAKLPVISRFIGTRATGQENIGWDRLEQAKERVNREFMQNPEIRRLGITMGQVPEDVQKVRLTPAERASLQQREWEAIEPLIRRVMSSSTYDRLTDTSKRDLLGKVMEAGRNKAQADFFKELGKEEILRRLRERAPVGVK